MMKSNRRGLHFVSSSHRPGEFISSGRSQPSTRTCMEQEFDDELLQRSFKLVVATRESFGGLT